jgi:hypothetical protein
MLVSSVVSVPTVAFAPAPDSAMETVPVEAGDHSTIAKKVQIESEERGRDLHRRALR